jgi:hypothetical protein
LPVRQFEDCVIWNWERKRPPRRTSTIIPGIFGFLGSANPLPMTSVQIPANLARLQPWRLNRKCPTILPILTSVAHESRILVENLGLARIFFWPQITALYSAPAADRHYKTASYSARTAVIPDSPFDGQRFSLAPLLKGHVVILACAT